MTKYDVVENKISTVFKYLSILERYQDKSKEEIESDIDLRGTVERYLYLTVQATIDLAEAYISTQNFRKPSTMSEAFHILNEQNIIGSKLTNTMVKMTGFRNIIAHDYEDINYDILYSVLTEGKKDIERFTNSIKTHVA